jgi:hypothetical protein
MTRYLLSIYQPDGALPEPEVLEQIGAELHRLNEDLKAAGSWVFTGGLHSPHSATVVSANGMMTDGPYLEGKEHIGGLWVIEAADLDAALDWATRAAVATTLPVEVRPFQDVPDY